MELLVKNHYKREDLFEKMMAGFEAAGINVQSLNRADIAGAEEFHTRGREATHELSGLMSLKSGQTVLDIGCGVGGPARVMASEYGCMVTGLDLVEEYVQTAQKLNERLGRNEPGLTKSVKFVQGNALDLPFRDNAFDAVTEQHIQMNIERKSDLYKEAFRVLKRGGVLGIHTICAGNAAPVHYPVPWADDPSISFLVQPSELKNILSELFEIKIWNDVTEKSRDWFVGVQKKNADRPADAPPPVGLNLLIGPTVSTKIGNMVKNLSEGRVSVIQAVMVKK